MPRKKNGVRNTPRPPPQAEDSGLMWSVLGFLSVVAAILLFVGGGLPNWRVSPAISYHYMASKTSASQQYASSTYGLYLINFNGGASTKNWYRLQSLVCQAYSIQNSAGILVSGCGTECNGHYNTRCSVYVKLQTYGYLTLGTVIVSGCLALLAAAWVFVFGVNRVVLQLLWLGGGLAALAVTGFYIYMSDQHFTALTVQSQFPFPVLSTAAYITISGCVIMILCGLTALLLGYLADRAAWAERQAEIRRRILGDTGAAPDAFGYPTGGLMMGMPNPNAYRSPLHAGAGPRLGAGIPGASGAPGFAPPGGGLYGNAPGPPGGGSRGIPGAAWGPGPSPRVDAGRFGPPPQPPRPFPAYR